MSVRQPVRSICSEKVLRDRDKSVNLSNFDLYIMKKTKLPKESGNKKSFYLSLAAVASIAIVNSSIELVTHTILFQISFRQIAVAVKICLYSSVEEEDEGALPFNNTALKTPRTYSELHTWNEPPVVPAAYGKPGEMGSV